MCIYAQNGVSYGAKPWKCWPSELSCLLFKISLANLSMDLAFTNLCHALVSVSVPWGSVLVWVNGRAIAVLRPHSRFHVHLSNGAHPVFIYSSLLRCLSNRICNISVYSHKRASCVCLCIILLKRTGPYFYFVHVIYGVLSSRPINCVHIRSYVLEYERIQFLLSYYYFTFRVCWRLHFY